jgi:hypothetical protein
MSKIDTLLAQFLKNPFEVRFEALDKLLKSYGFECRRASKDQEHWIYKRAGFRPLPIPRKQKVKSCYVKQALTMLQELIEPDDELVNLWIKRLTSILVYPIPAN